MWGDVMGQLRKQKGQALVEFAIILPVLLLLVMGIIQFGLMFNSYISVCSASREGARVGVVGSTDAQIESAIRTDFPSINTSDLTIAVTTPDSNRTPGEALTVTVTYKYHITIPIIKNLLSDAINIRSQTSMRIE